MLGPLGAMTVAPSVGQPDERIGLPPMYWVENTLEERVASSDPEPIKLVPSGRVKPRRISLGHLDMSPSPLTVAVPGAQRWTEEEFNTGTSLAGSRSKRVKVRGYTEVE